MSNYNLSDENGNIVNGLRADIMRCCMENKNLLQNRGDMYVGTGTTIELLGGVQIPKTTTLPLGDAGEVLMSKDGDLCYSKIITENFNTSFNGKNRVCSDFGLLTELGQTNPKIPASASLCSFQEAGQGIVREKTVITIENQTYSYTYTPSSSSNKSHFVLIYILASITQSAYVISNYEYFDYGLVYLPPNTSDQQVFLYRPNKGSNVKTSQDWPVGSRYSGVIKIQTDGPGYSLELERNFVEYLRESGSRSYIVIKQIN